MSFTTFEFFLFIAAAVIIYYVIPKKLQWIWLLIISYVYYASYDISTVWMLLLTTYVTYRGGILLDRLNEQKPQDGISREEKKDFKKNIVRKKKKIVLAMVLIAFGMLGIMKYTNFMLGNIDAVLRLFGSGKQIGVLNLTLPLGISFYTFQSISYVVDVYRGKHKAQGNFFKHALFVSFFPQLLQGPIGRYERLGSQLYEGHSYNLKELQFGVQRILWGFFKKMVLADRVNAAVLLIFHNYWNYGGWYNVLGVLLYSIQLYADFSGGIDIVIGIADVWNYDG
ncbi:MAG: MBOAT family O-acyltransferase [Lachnospira pectinoschiza]